MPSVKAPTQRAPEIADAAEHHDHEAVDDVALAEIGRDVVDLRQRHAGDAGDAGPEREGHGIDPAGADAHRAAMRRFCVTARICRPSGVALSSTRSSATNTTKREDDDPQPAR